MFLMIRLVWIGMGLAGIALASPEYARRTQKDCSYCHPPKNYTLTDAGKYYQAHRKSLQGYVPKASTPQARPDPNAKGNTAQAGDKTAR
jgi:hypothetical protein